MLLNLTTNPSRARLLMCLYGAGIQMKTTFLTVIEVFQGEQKLHTLTLETQTRAIKATVAEIFLKDTREHG